MVSYFIFFNEKTRYIFLQQTFKEGLLAAAPVFTYRLGNMAGRTYSHWAEEMLLGFSSGRSNAIEQRNLTETFYLYRALVARQTKP